MYPQREHEAQWVNDRISYYCVCGKLWNLQANRCESQVQK